MTSRRIADRSARQLRLTLLRPSCRARTSVVRVANPSRGPAAAAYTGCIAHGEQVLTGDSFFSPRLPTGDPLPVLTCRRGRVVCLIDSRSATSMRARFVHPRQLPLAGNVRGPGGVASAVRSRMLFPICAGRIPGALSSVFGLRLVPRRVAWRPILLLSFFTGAGAAGRALRPGVRQGAPGEPRPDASSAVAGVPPVASLARLASGWGEYHSM